ncbi:UbiA prenyltransferase family-domain-containing protein [Cubamyces lactineus]|nr:UbiA prenyltransferase family-domain-containing protein [Cubamyces lactineus]
MPSSSALSRQLARDLRTLRDIPHFLHTLFLFTKSDIKTTVFPVTSLAIASAPIDNILRLPHVVFWVWTHVLQFDLSNQTVDPQEDALNKRERPIPAQRITLASARLLRWLVVPVCWRLSALYSVQTVYASIANIALTIIYDDLGAASGHWAVRNVVNGLGFSSFEVGATLIAGSDPRRLDSIAMCSILASVGIFVTTIHAQDFKDVEGDRAVGRRTIPIVFGDAAKYTVLFPLLAWSLGLSVFWGLEYITAAAFTALATYVGALYLRAKTVREYQVAFYWYNVWLTSAHALPAYHRVFSQHTTSSIVLGHET